MVLTFDESTVPDVPYECDRCGACCKAFIVEADLVDVLRDPRILEVPGNLVTLAKLIEDDSRCVLVAACKPCHFLDAGNLCTIYPTRPNACVGFFAGSEQCQEARSRKGVPPLLPSNAIGA